MPKPDENQPNGNEPGESGGGTLTLEDKGTKPPAGGNDDGLKDKHGEDAINRGRYDRDMKAKEDEIAELKKQLAESDKKARRGDDALKKVEALEAQIADEKVSHALQAAGCVNEKAAKALLDDYEGDVAKLKEACPYLFKRQQGSTGAKPGGAPSASEERRKRAKEAIKGKFPARR